MDRPTEEQHDAPSPTERLDAWLALTGRAEAPNAPDAPDTPLRLPMLSGSMKPALPPGSMLRIVPPGRGAVAAGDVVVFADGDRLVAHRIAWRLRLPGLDRVLEMGDANPRGNWRRTGDVRGIVREAELPDGRVVPVRDAAVARRGLKRHLRHLLAAVFRGRERHHG